MEAGSDAMTALWARNKFGWDRPASTMTFSLPNANGDLGEWIMDLVHQAREAGCKIYFKTNLLRSRWAQRHSLALG
jgi:hypothetical protein